MVYEYSAVSNATDKLISRYRDERKQKLIIEILKKSGAANIVKTFLILKCVNQRGQH